MSNQGLDLAAGVKALSCICAPWLGDTNFCLGLEEPAPAPHYHPGDISAQPPRPRGATSCV